MAHPSSQPMPSCTAQRKGGDFCGLRAMPDAPFPLCGKHVRQVFEFAAEFVSGANLGEVLDRYRQIPGSTSTAWVTADPRPHPRNPLVYYVRMGDLIKIGFTESIANRMKAFPPDAELLAVEVSPDARRVEKKRHRQFEHMLAGRAEWFHAKPELLEFVAGLRPVSA